MKLFVKLMICLTFLALAGPFFLKGPDGRPLMSLSSLGLGNIPGQINAMFRSISQASMNNNASNTASDDPANNPDGLTLVAGDQVYYRWQDENGIWQFTTERPPASASNYVPVVTNPNANVIQSLNQDKINETLGIRSEPALSAGNNFRASQGKTAELSEELEALGYKGTLNPLEQIPKILQQTDQIKKTMESRDAVLDGL